MAKNPSGNSSGGDDKSPTGEFFSTLKNYFNQLSEGEKTPTEVASAFNGWAREGADNVKAKIALEVEANVAKMGFIKREEYEQLLSRVSALETALRESVGEGDSKSAKKAEKKARKRDESEAKGSDRKVLKEESKSKSKKVSKE